MRPETAVDAPVVVPARPRRFLLPALVALAAVLLALAAVWLLRPRGFHGLELNASAPVADFTLTAHTGEQISLGNLRGKVVALYFGYTHCPDACPTAMSTLRRAMQLLGRRSDGVQVLMVTVDPERDTPAELGPYVTQFDPRFLGLTGSADEIRRAAIPFGIYYQAQKIESASGYTVDHTTTITLVDKAGRMRLVYPLNTPADDIASDLAILLKEK